jgi:hypothetical protein
MQSFIWCLLHAGDMLDIIFKPEEGAKMFLRNVGEFNRTTNHYIPEYSTLHSKRYENLVSDILTE